MTVDDVVKLQKQLWDSYEEYKRMTDPATLPMRVVAEARRPYWDYTRTSRWDAYIALDAAIEYGIFPALEEHYKSLSWWGKRKFRWAWYRVFTGKADFDGQWQIKEATE